MEKEQRIDELLKQLFNTHESDGTYCITGFKFIRTDEARKIVLDWLIANRLEKLVMPPNGKLYIMLNGCETKIQKVDERLIITTDGDLIIRPRATNRACIEAE